jgi:hypothetical protein
MRGIVLSLAAVSGLGVALVGGRAIAAGRAGAAQPTTATALASAAAPAAAGPVWYGGTLAPIVVVATVPPGSSRRATQCDRAGG